MRDIFDVTVVNSLDTSTKSHLVTTSTVDETAAKGAGGQWPV